MYPPVDTLSRRDLGDGLILRWSTSADTEPIATLHGLVHRDKADDPPNQSVIRYIRALMHGDHLFMGPHDFALIEDTGKEGHPVVACTCLWKHTWTYEGIPLSVGRPEMVATDATYRHRGLIRALFEVVHARSEAEGDLVQAITGIAYFYRQFGYEYALELEDRRVTPVALIPPAREGETEMVSLRAATREDVPLIERLYERRRIGSIVSTTITRTQWLYDIEQWKTHPELGRSIAFQMIVGADGQTIGFIAPDASRRGKHLGVWLLEFDEGVNISAVMPSLLRALDHYGVALEVSRPNAAPFSEISFNLGSTHPVHEVLGSVLDRADEPPYAWYVRVKNLPAFLMHIAPALEKRLASSPVAGYSGEIKLDFYRDGLKMVFERGHLLAIEGWRPPFYGSEASAAFPPLVFLQVVFGHRSIEALREILPDVWVNPETRLLLKTLFPTRPSFVFAWN